MGVDFDPDWEYYQPDPEIEEIIEGNKRGIVDETDCNEEGFPFILWNHFSAKWSDIELEAFAYAYAGGMSLKELGYRSGNSASTVYNLLRRAGVRLRRGGRLSKSRLILRCKYRKCGKKFPTTNPKSVFCCITCCNRHTGQKRRKSARKRLFVRLWNSGTLVNQIETQMGLSRITISKWRKELNLPSRRKSHASVD